MLKSLPKAVLDLFPMWEYRCSKCGTYVEPDVLHCPNCLAVFDAKKWRVPPRFLKSKKAMGDYAHKVLAPKLTEEQRNLLFQYFTVIFEDGFESGDFSAWTGTNGSPSIVSSPVHHGTYAAEFDASGEYCYKSISEPTVYLRFYVRASEIPDASSEWLIFTRNYGGGTAIFEAGITVSGGEARWGIHYRNGTTWTETLSDPATINLDTWYCFEVYWKKDASAGEMHLYIDEVDVVNATGLDTDDYGNCTTIRVGVTYAALGGEGFTVTVDCVVVADVYIGPEAEVTNVTVTDSLSLTDSVLSNKTFSVSDVLGLSDMILRNKTLVITDSVGANDAILGNKSPLIVADAVSLSELINVITEAMLKTVTDQVSLSDGAKVLKQLGVSDAVTLVDGVNVTERILRVLDAVALADTLHVNKFLQVTETISLTEVVQVGVEGVKKTKLFLMLGELAVQLTGD